MDVKNSIFTVSDMPASDNSVQEVLVTMEPNSTEGRESTRTILEDVCTDFESIDVSPPKNNKIGVIKNVRRRNPPQQSSNQKKSASSIVKGKGSSSVKSSANKGINDKVLVAVRKEVLALADAVPQKETPITSTPVQPLQDSSCTAIINVESGMSSNPEFLPLNNCQNSDNVAVLPEAFAGDKNISSLAQLADAEIVQTGDKVSIIVTNPRFIEVLTNTNNAVAGLQPAAVIESPDAVLEADVGATQQIDIVDSSILNNSVFRITDDLTELQEQVVSDREDSCSSSLPETSGADSRVLKRGGPGWGRLSTKKSGLSQPCYTPSAPASRARRVTAKMKAGWARLLEIDGHLSCQMPGCSQTFVTVANYQTHYKFCTGKKTLQKCDYCDSMIFSTYRAMLQHMEVEHPEKVDEYRASLPEEIPEIQRSDSPAHLLVAEDENVAMNVEEVTQQPQKNSKKRKLSPKENTVPHKKVILKHKLQSIQNSMAENAKEFKKCVRFDAIADKINSIDEACNFETPSSYAKRKEKRKKLVFSERIVAERKYFVDDDDEDVDAPKTPAELEIERQENLRERMHTKARMVLNLDRYKRYQEYLTVTRDWSSERKTYSRPGIRDTPAESSSVSQVQNESFQDMHQLNNTTESSSISLNTTSEAENTMQLQPSDTYQVLETPEFVSVISMPPENVVNTSSSSVVEQIDKCSQMLSNEFGPFEPLVSSVEKTPDSVKKEKTACYNRVNFESPKPKPARYGRGIITYGLKVPREEVNKPVEPPVTFDSLVNFMKPVRKNSQTGSDKAENALVNIENVPKPTKEDGIKLPNNNVENSISPKRKRGRPPKPKSDPHVDPKATNITKNKMKKSANRGKKYSAAMLKSIEKNVKNRKIKLFGVKKNSKFKSKNFTKASQVHSKKSVKNSKLKQSKRNLLAKSVINKNKKYAQNKSVDESARQNVQCQENIDNHLSLGQELENIPHISCLSADHNYTHTDITVSSVIEDHLIVDGNNIVGEVEVVTTNVEDTSEPVADKCETISENVPVDNATAVIQEVKESGPTNMSSINSEEGHNDLVIDCAVLEKDSQNLVENSSGDKTELTEVNKTQLAEIDKTQLIETGETQSAEIDKIQVTEVDKTQLTEIGNAQLTETNKTQLTETNKTQLTETDNTQLTEIDNTQLMEVSKQVTEMPESDETEKNVNQNYDDQNGKKSIDSVEPIPKDIQNNQKSVSNVQSNAADKSENIVLGQLDQNVESSLPDKKSDGELSEQGGKIENICSEVPDLSVDKTVQLNLAAEESQNTSVVIEHAEPMLICDSVPSQEKNTVGLEGQFTTQEVQNSDSNQKVENVVPEVKVKRGRGRPKKNANKKSPPGVSAAESSKQDTVNIVKLNKSKVTDVKANQTDTETPSEGGMASTDDNKSIPAVRKSERVKRRKLVDDEIFQTPTVEAKPKDEVTPSTPVIRTGRRGRPRKCPPTDSPMESSDGKIEGAAPKVVETDSETVDENQRKFSRKGRPRKCVRYADLNSGLESSESLDGLNSGSSVKDKPESVKGRKTVHKSHDVKESNENEVEIVEIHNSSNEQEEEIVLPLKKRKQRQAKKDDSEVENIKSSKNTEADIQLSDEENKENPEEEDVPEKKSLRGRKSVKGSKKKKSGKKADLSDEDWELSDHISNVKQTSRKSRRKSSRIDLMHLEETSESSNSEKNDPTVDFSKELKDTTNIRKSSHKPKSKCVEPAALKYSLRTSSAIFSEYKPQKCMWTLHSDKDCILPPLKISAFFKTEKVWKESEAYWNSLSLFDSAPLDNDSSHCTFFTGGPVSCSAWCPVPVDGNKVQYVALAASYAVNKIHSYVCDETDRGLLQLWNVGVLNDKIVKRKPFMEMGIFHKYGPITDMAWCPVGCWEDPATTEVSDGVLPRLGLLAVACADSNVRVYSIPHPHLLHKEGTSFPIYVSSPSIVLEPMHGDICIVTRKSICVSLAWQKSDGCERIAAGYGNGMICVWRINSSATILTVKENNQTIINPYLAFNAHGTPVFGVSFSPLLGGRYIVSSSIDKTLKFWDLIDTSLPLFAVKKGAGRCAEWSSQYCGAFGSIEYGMNNFKGSTFFKECGTETCTSRTLSSPCCSVIKNALSEWLNAQAIASITGNVSVSFMNSLIQDQKSPQYFHRLVYLSELKPVEGIVEKIAFSSYPESIDCVNVIQETSEVASVLSKVIEKSCEVTTVDINSLRQLVNNNIQKSLESPAVELFSEQAGNVNCLMEIEQMKDIISVVHEISENCEPVDVDMNDQESAAGEVDTLTNVPLDDLEKFLRKGHNRDDEAREKELEISESVPNKLSEITDIVTLVTDIKDVTNTVGELVHNSKNSGTQVQLLSSVLDGRVPETLSYKVGVPCIEIPSEVLTTTVYDPVKNSIEIIQSSTEVVGVLHNLINTVEKDEVISCHENRTDSSLIIAAEERITDESVIANINSESITCISKVEEIVNIVSTMDHITKECEKKEISRVSLNVPIETEKADTDDSAKRSMNVKECPESEVMEDKKENYGGTGLPLSEVKNAVISVINMKRVTDALVSMTNVADTITDMKVITETVEYLKNTGAVTGLKDVSKAVKSLKDIHKDVWDIEDTAESVKSVKNMDVEETTKVIMDMKAATEIVMDLKDATETVMDMKDSTEVVMDMKDAIEVAMDMKDATEAVMDMKDATEVVMDMKDATEVVMDMKDATELVMDMKDAAELVVDMTDATELVIDLKDTTEVVTDMTDTIASVENLKDVTAAMEELISDSRKASSEENEVLVSNSKLILSEEAVLDINENSVANISVSMNSASNTENCLVSEIAVVVNDVIESVSKEMDNVKNLSPKMVSNLHKLNNLESFETEESVPSNNVGNEDDLQSSDMSVELITPSPPTESSISKENGIKYNTHVPHAHYQLDLQDEMDEQMLSADSDSSNSDNDMDTDDDGMEMVHPYMFDQDSNLSDASMMSERSLDSVGSFSSESDLSDASSSSSVHDEQEMDDPVPCSQNNNDAAESAKVTSETFSGVDSEDLNKNCESDALDTNRSETSEDVAAEEANVNSVSDASASNLCDTLSDNKLVSDPTDKAHDSCHSEVLQAFPNSEMSVEVSEEGALEAVNESNVTTNRAETQMHTGDMLLGTDKSCDISSSNVETAKTLVESSSKTCTENTDKNASCIDSRVNLGESLQESCDNNNVLPKTVENIFNSSKSTETVVNSEHNVSTNESGTSTETEPIVDNLKKTLSPTNFSCYEDVISQYGIVFKDMNTAKFESIENRSFEELDEYSLTPCHLTSIKTVSWNPNFGSHCWLFSAGQSGIARLSFISDINHSPNFERRSK